MVQTSQWRSTQTAHGAYGTRVHRQRAGECVGEACGGEGIDITGCKSVDDLRSPALEGSSTEVLSCWVGANSKVGDLHSTAGGAGAGEARATAGEAGAVEAGVRTSTSTRAATPPATGGCPQSQKKGALGGHPAARHLRRASAIERLRFFTIGSVLSLAAASAVGPASHLSCR